MMEPLTNSSAHLGDLTGDPPTPPTALDASFNARTFERVAWHDARHSHAASDGLATWATFFARLHEILSGGGHR